MKGFVMYVTWTRTTIVWTLHSRGFPAECGSVPLVLARNQRVIWVSQPQIRLLQGWNRWSIARWKTKRKDLKKRVYLLLYRPGKQPCMLMDASKSDVRSLIPEDLYVYESDEDIGVLLNWFDKTETDSCTTELKESIINVQQLLLNQEGSSANPSFTSLEPCECSYANAVRSSPNDSLEKLGFSGIPCSSHLQA